MLRSEGNVARFVAAQAGDDLSILDVIFAEIRFGIKQLVDPDRRTRIATWLEDELRSLSAGRTLATDEQMLLRWYLLLRQVERHMFGQLDLPIAACALEHGV
jgi:predicted nucleic acid-binding protein